MQLTVNGKTVILERPLSVLQYVERLGISPHAVAVEYNQEILKRERYAQTELREGDVLEIVRMVGGGCDRLSLWERAGVMGGRAVTFMKTESRHEP